MMTINNKSERNDRGKCHGGPVTSYGPGVIAHRNLPKYRDHTNHALDAVVNTSVSPFY